MNASEPHEDALASVSREELMAAMFGHLVIQNTNMALMFLGQVAHPQTGEKVQDLDAARMFIDQLEMLECKTKGNLTSEEEKLLQQSLTHLRLAFVEAVEHPGNEKTAPAADQTGAPIPAEKIQTSGAIDDDAETRKRFSKKY